MGLAAMLNKFKFYIVATLRTTWKVLVVLATLMTIYSVVYAEFHNENTCKIYVVDFHNK